MPVTWHRPARWWDWCMSGDDKKRIEPIFTNTKYKLADNKMWGKMVRKVDKSDKDVFSRCQQYMIWRYRNIFEKNICMNVCTKT